MSEFNGFSKNTVAFLRGLSKNNNKEWFDSHRAAYEEHFIGPAKAFVEAVGEELRRIAPPDTGGTTGKWIDFSNQ